MRTFIFIGLLTIADSISTTNVMVEFTEFYVAMFIIAAVMDVFEFFKKMSK